MKNILLVGVGGFAGCVLRYLVVAKLFSQTSHDKFPLGTFIVNLIGCLLIGILTGLTEKHQLLGEAERLLLITGLLGGFTTFSAFGLEALGLLRKGDYFFAALYVGGSVCLGLGAAAFGLKWASA